MSIAVLVDVPPIEAAAAASALKTCNAALGDGRCALAGPGLAGDWYAVVRFEPDQKAALSIELRDGSAGGTEVASSELVFTERDSLEERWASAGVVVAALVAAQSAERPAEPAHVEPPLAAQAPISARPLAPSAPAAAKWCWPRLDLGLTGGSEAGTRALRFGPFGRFGLALHGLPLFGFASAAYTVRGEGAPGLAWFSGTLGVGARAPFAGQHAALELRGEAVLESLSIQASDGARTEGARRTRYGARLGLDLVGYLTSNLALLAGAELGLLRPGVQIVVNGVTVERLRPAAWGFISAFRYEIR